MTALSSQWLEATLESLCIIEFVIIVLLAIVCIGSFGFLRILSQRQQKLQEEARTFVLKLFENQEPIYLSTCPKSLRRLTILLPALESLDRKVNSSLWKSHKLQVAKQLLLPQARLFASHKKWVHRALAAKCFALAPLQEDEFIIIKLLNDEVPLVYSIAAPCAVALESPNCIHATLDKMVRASRFARSTLRDALLRGSTVVYSLLESRYLKESDPKVRLCCLQILSAKVSSHNLFRALKADIDSNFLELRLEAIRSLVHNPSKEAIDLLIRLLDDPNYEIQALAARILGRLNAQEAIPKLTKKLQDLRLWVRLNVALSLKDLGKEGIKILKMQDADLNELAYNVADFVLTLPSSNTARLERWYT